MCLSDLVRYITTGGNNTLSERNIAIALGYQAGDNITTGSNNIMIGYDIDAADPAGDDQLNIGDTIFGDLSTGKVGIGRTPSPDHLEAGAGNENIDFIHLQ